MISLDMMIVLVDKMVPYNKILIGRNIPEAGFAIADFREGDSKNKEGWVMRWFDINGIGQANFEGKKRYLIDYFVATSPVIFHSHGGNYSSIKEFIEKTEEILETSGTLPFDPPVSSFCCPHTECGQLTESVMYIEPSQFWMEHHLRRSLFVYLLGSARKYRSAFNNYESIVASGDNKANYTAISRFLFGFTEFNMDFLNNVYGASLERQIKDLVKDRLKKLSKTSAASEKAKVEATVRKETEDSFSRGIRSWTDVFAGQNEDFIRKVLIAPAYDQTRTLTIEGVWS